MGERRLDPLFGPDGTSGPDAVAPDPLPGFEPPGLDVPAVSGGRVTGLAGEDVDLDDVGVAPMPAAGTVAWLVAQRAAAGGTADSGSPARGTADPATPPAAPRPATEPRNERAVVRPVAQGGPTVGGHRPPIEPEQSILGLSRHTRSRFGSRLFTWFFVGVFVVILIQLVVSLLTY